MTVLHLITNFTGAAGAETMLARIVRSSSLDTPTIMSLMALSERNVGLGGPDARYQALGAGSLARMALSPLAVAKLLRRQQFAAVMCWMYHAMVVGTLAHRLAAVDTPLYWNVRQSLDDTKALSRSTRTAVTLSRRLSHLPTGIVFNSSRALELHRRAGFRNPNCLVIPNGVDVAETLTARGPARRFGMAARLNPQKDHPTLFRAIAIARRARPDLRFALAGAGLTRDNPAVRQMMDESRVDSAALDLLGEVEDMSAFYAGIDALLLSSRTEGFPNVVVEAMAHGRPVITTDVGDAAEIVGDTGIVVPAAQPQALAKAITRFYDLPASDLSALASRAQARARAQYALASVADRYDRLLGSGAIAEFVAPALDQTPKSRPSSALNRSTSGR